MKLRKKFTPEEQKRFNKKADLFKKVIDACNIYGTLIHVDFKNKELIKVDSSNEETYNEEELGWYA